MSKSVFRPADILLPRAGSMETWSVIACDQFTSERAYWDRVRERVGDEPSTLRMIIPEAYLADEPSMDAAARTAEVMDRYLREGIFETLPASYVYVEREVTGGVRHGVVGTIDLEAYEFRPGSGAPVRASEWTVAERLPPRVLIREKASLELPHILVLTDDPDRAIVEPLREKKKELRKLYDFPLMEEGGRIAGWAVSGADAAALEERFAALARKPLQFVIGDGNHSLAAAKELWNRVKKTLPEAEWESHPARYALCEVVNVYDEGIAFEPIHRVAFGVNAAELIRLAHEKLDVPGGRRVDIVAGGRVVDSLSVRGRSFGNMIDAVQDLLEEYAAVYEAEIDYIHDEEAVLRLTAQEGAVGFLLPAMGKEELFGTVTAEGVFPKKSFSIGHARDKRYYLECRKIVK